MIKLIIFDWKRTLYDPDNKLLIDGALELLKSIKKRNIPIILVGKGGDDMNKEIKRLAVDSYFEKIIFIEGEKDLSIYKPLISKKTKDTLFIGDRVRSELEAGNKLGAITVWIKQGKFADEEPENEQQKPTFTVLRLRQCIRLISKNFF